jgi:hypothetical protein
MKQISKVEDVFGVEYYPNLIRNALKKKFFPKNKNPLHLQKAFSYKKFDLKNVAKKKLHMTDYLNRKALSNVFQENIGDNAVLILGLNGYVSLLMDKSVVASFKLSNLAPGLPRSLPFHVMHLGLDSITYAHRYVHGMSNERLGNFNNKKDRSVKKSKLLV